MSTKWNTIFIEILSVSGMTYDIHFFSYFFIIGYYKLLNIVPCAMSTGTLFILYVVSVCKSQCILPW